MVWFTAHAILVVMVATTVVRVVEGGRGGRTMQTEVVRLGMLTKQGCCCCRDTCGGTCMWGVRRTAGTWGFSTPLMVMIMMILRPIHDLLSQLKRILFVWTRLNRVESAHQVGLMRMHTVLSSQKVSVSGLSE